MEVKQLRQTDLPEVIKLSLSIFKPKTGKNDWHHNIERWREYFKQGGILLGAFVNHKLAGYLFSYKREPGKNSLHCQKSIQPCIPI